MKRLRKAAAMVAAFSSLLLISSGAGADDGAGQGYGPPPPPLRYVSPRKRSHLYVGGSLGGFAILAQVTDQAGYMGQGGGGAVHVGYRFSKMLGLELNLGITYHDEKLGQVGGLDVIAIDNLFLMTSTVDVKVYFSSKGWIEPFVQAGLGYAWLGATYGDVYCESFSCDTTFAQGPTYQLGGGLDMWLWPRVNLSVRLLYRGIYFKEANYGNVTVRNDNGNFINGVALDVGASFHF